MSFYQAYFVPSEADPYGLVCRGGKCCCCSNDVRLKGKPKPQNSLNGHPGIGVKFVVEFEADWRESIIDEGKAERQNDCTLIWKERSTKGLNWPPAVRGRIIRDVKEKFGKKIKISPQKSRKWYDQYTELWFLKQFRPWRDDRKKPCPGKEATPIEDTPGIWDNPGTNILQFELILKSSSNCTCAAEEKKLCFEVFVSWTSRRGRIWHFSPIECTPHMIPMGRYR